MAAFRLGRALMPRIELPKTNLRLQGQDLLKYSHPEALVGSFPLSQIVDVRLERHTEFFGLIAAGMFAALAAVAKAYIPWPGVAWAATIVALAAALLCTLIVSGRKIVIETKDGLVSYIVADAFEEAEGFVVSLRQILRTGKLDDAGEPDAA
jgi:hypothetical protein